MPNFFQRKILAGRENRAVADLWSIVLAAIGLAVLWSLGAPPATAQEIQIAGDPADWRALWDQMMPVFTSPRCINCHGGTDPFTGVNHNNGLAVDDDGRDSSCTECHSARVGTNGVKVWNSHVTSYGSIGAAPSFVKGGAASPPVPKEASEICKEILQRMKEKLQGPGFVVTHVQHDFLIGLAFEGRRADAIPNSDPAEPPPMSRELFVGLVRHWVTDAAAACDLNGTVKITETLTGSRTVTQTPPGGAPVAMSQEESGTRTITADVHNGKATVKADGSGKAQTVQRTDVGGCVVTITNENAATSTGEGEGQFSLKVAPGASGLKINLAGPEETGSQKVSALMQSTCPGGGDVSTPLQDNPVTGSYPYSIEVKVPQPPTGVITELTGTDTQTYTWPMSPLQTGTVPWLLCCLTISPDPDAQGQPPTVTVKTEWNLKLY